MKYNIKLLSMIFISIILSTFTTSCKNGISTQKEMELVQSEIDRMHHQVMEIHDDVMPKMKDIYRLKKELKSDPNDQVAQELIHTLDKADAVMMDWMAQYKKPKIENKSYGTYLSKQLASIKIVKSTMNDAIADTKAYVESHKTK